MCVGGRLELMRELGKRFKEQQRSGKEIKKKINYSFYSLCSFYYSFKYTAENCINHSGINFCFVICTIDYALVVGIVVC